MLRENDLAPKPIAYNLAQASQASGLGQWALKRAVWKKKLKVYKPTGKKKGNPMLFLPHELEAFVLNGEVDKAKK